MYNSSFFDTKAGHDFATGAIPELINAIVDLKNINRELVRVNEELVRIMLELRKKETRD